MAGEETPGAPAAEPKEEKTVHAIVNYLLVYECPVCHEELGQDEGGIDEANEFYSKHDAVKKVTCGSCKQVVHHDPVIVRTIPEGKP